MWDFEIHALALQNILGLWFRDQEGFIRPRNIYHLLEKVPGRLQTPMTLSWMGNRIYLIPKQPYIFFPIYLVKAKSLGIVNTQKRYPNLRLATNLRLTILNSSRWTDKKQQTLPESMGWHNPYFTEYHTGLSGTSDRNIYELGNKSCLLLMEVGSGSIFIPESYVYRDTTVLCMNVEYQTLKWP